MKSNQLVALVENFDMYDRMLNEYMLSSGSAMAENEKRMDSWQAKANQFSNALAKMWDNTISTDTVKLIIDFGTATVGVIDKIGLLTIIIGGLNVALAVTGRLAGSLGFIAPAILAVVVAYNAYNKVMEKIKNNYRELIDATQKEADNHKALASQYEQDIKKTKELIEARNKLAESSNKLSEADKEKTNINQSLLNSEQELGKVIGQQALDKLKAAGFTEDATKIVIDSLEERQNAEKLAYEKSSELVTQQTEHLRRNIENQIKQISLAVQAYGVLGKIQEVGLAVEKKLAYARFKLNPTVKNAKAYDDIVKQIEEFYAQQKNNKIGELLEQLNNLGGVKPPSIDNPNPLGGGAGGGGAGGGGAGGGGAGGAGGSTTSPKISTFNLYESSLKRINDELSILKEKLESDPSLQAEINLKLNFKKDLIEREKVEIENALKEAYKELESINKDYADRIRRGDDVSDLVIINNEALANAIDNVLKLKSVYGDLEKALWDVNKEFKSLYESLIKIQKDMDKATLDRYANELDAFKKSREAIIEGYQAQIDLLEEKADLEEESIERQRRIMEIEKAQQRLTNTLNEKNTRIFVEGVGWTWQANPQDVRNAQDDLKNLQEDYADWERKNTVSHQRQMLQNQIKYEQDSISQKQKWFDSLKSQFEESWKNMELLSENYLSLFGDNIDAAVSALLDKMGILNGQLKGMTPTSGGISGGGTTSSGGSGSSSNGRDPSKITVTNPNTGTQFYIKKGTEDNYKGYIFSGGGYAKGTTSAAGGLSMVGEEGAELRVLNRGDGIIPSQITKNLMTLGQPNIMDRMMNLIKTPSFTPSFAGMGGKSETFNIYGNISLPNVKDVNDFTSQLKQRSRLK